MQRYKNQLRGFLVPYNFTEQNVMLQTGTNPSNFTTLDPFADVPLPARTSSLFVGATGGTIINTDLQVVVSKAGSASTSEYTIKDNQLSTTIKYGSFADTLIVDWQNIKVPTASVQYKKHDIVSDNDGGYIVAVEKMVGGSTLSIVTTATDAQGNTTSSTLASLGVGVSFGSSGNPCLIHLNDNIFLCCVVTVSSFDEASINVYRSEDAGNSFSLISKAALSDVIDVSSGEYTIERLSGAAINGQILLVFSAKSASSSYTNKNHVLQYASVDGGGTFKKVTTSTEVGTASFKSVQVYTTHNQFALCYIGEPTEVHNMIMPHAFFSAQSLRTAGKYIVVNSSTVIVATGTAANMTDGRVTAHLTANGDIFIYARGTSSKAIIAFQSSDYLNWFGLFPSGVPTQKPSVFYVDTTVTFDDFTSAPYQGGSILAHNWPSSNALAVAYLGGFSNVTYGMRGNHPQPSLLARGQNNFTWLPILLPSASSELTKSGTGVEVLESQNVNLTIAHGQSNILYTRNQTNVTASAFGAIVHVEVEVLDDVSGLLPFVTELTTEDAGGPLYKLDVRVSESKIRVSDGTSAALLLDQTITSNAKVEFIVTIFDGKGAFYWRYSGYDSLRLYNVGFNDTSITNAGTGSTTQTTTVMGIRNAPPSGQTAQSKVYKYFVSDSEGVVDITNLSSSDIIGKRFSTIQPQYIDSGVSIFAQDGPGYIGDEWTIKATSNSSTDNLFYNISPSPRVQWQSESVSSGADLPDQRFILELSNNATDLGNDLIALHLANINFKDLKIEYFNGVSYVALHTIETSDGCKHGYLRSGKSIKQNSGLVFDKNYYFYNELKGYVAMLQDGGSTEFYNVVSNSEGGFGQVTGKQATVILDGEPSFNGTVYFIPPSVTVVMSLNGVDGNRWALRLPAQKTIHDQFRIGNVFLGAVAVTGTQYSKGRKISIEAGNIVEVTPDRTRYSKSYTLDQRTVSISWSDGVDVSAFYDNDPDPDFFKSSSSSGAEPVAVYQDAPYMLEGMIRGLQGSQTPLVYLPSITTSSDIRVYNRRAEHLLGVIDGQVNIESITGEELIGDGKGEVLRVGTINIVEVV